MFYPFLDAVNWISSDASIERKIANAHMLFNIGGVLVFVWFIPLFEKALNKILPSKNRNQIDEATIL